MQLKPLAFCFVIGFLAIAILYGPPPSADSIAAKNNSQQSLELLTEQQTALNALAQEYNEQVKHIGNILEPQMLADKAEVSKSLQKIDQFEKHIHSYFDKQAALQQALLAKSKTVFSSKEFADGFEKGFHEGEKNTAPLMARFKQNQLALVKQYKEMLTFASQKDLKLAENNELLLEEDADIEQYNALFAELQRLMADEQRIVEEINAVQTANKEKLKLLEK